MAKKSYEPPLPLIAVSCALGLSAFFAHKTITFDGRFGSSLQSLKNNYFMCVCIYICMYVCVYVEIQARMRERKPTER